MKNIKYLGFVGLGCAALLLTGCGGDSSKSNTDSGSKKEPVKHILTCSMSDETERLDIEVEFNDKEDEVKGAKIFLSTEIPEGTSDEEIETAKEYLDESVCSEDSYEDCEVSRKGNKLTVEASVTTSGLEDEDISGTKDEVSELFESQGYTCK